MHPPLFKLLLPATACLVIVGCGGSGGGSTCTGAACGTGTPTTVTVTFGGPALPTAVAERIGTGAFTAQTLSGNVLTLSVPSGTSNFAVAYLCPPNGENYEYIWEASTADGTSPTFTCMPGDNQPGMLTGNLDASAISGAQGFEILSQNASSNGESQVTGGATESFSLNAPSGNDRILVLAEDQSTGPYDPGPVAAKNFENQTVPGALNGGSVVFGSADATMPETITYSNVPSGYGSPSTLVDLVLGGADEELYALNLTGSYPELPASATESGDYYLLDAGAGGTESNSSCGVYAGMATAGGPVSFTAFPAPWNNCGTPSPTTLPTFNIDYTGFAGQANVHQEGYINWAMQTGSSLTFENIEVEATANYQSGSTTLAIPDLSGITGFLANPASGAQVVWYAEVWQTSYSPMTNSIPPLNATWEFVANGGNYQAP
jgi:hypothetical protein